MLNIPELERRWKRYRRRQKTPYYLLFSVTLLCCGAALYYYLDVKHAPKQKHSSEPHPSVSVSSSSTAAMANNRSDEHADRNSSVSESSPEPETAIKVKNEKNIVKLKPSMNFIDTFEESEEDEVDYYFAPKQSVPKTTMPQVKTIANPVPVTAPSKPDDTTLKAEKSPKQKSLPAITRKPVQPTTVPPVKRHQANPKPLAQAPKTKTTHKMIIQRENDMKDIQDVIARFKKNKNPALSLFVAKRYYAIGNYQQAYNYALITNEIDNSIEDSWLIFAKSLYKIGQKEMAIKTLQTYYDDSRSVKAKITLDQMKDGDFK